ncbi:MAG: hypothetical protein SGBAC_011493, partial [Bacillariaceae sp.]
MAFFENTFGFEESSYRSTQKGLLKRAIFSYAPPNPTRDYWQEHCSFQISNGDIGTRQVSAGTFSMPSVEQLRSRIQREMTLLSSHQKQQGARSYCATQEQPTVTVRNMVGEARSLHSEPFATILGKASKYSATDFPAENYYVFQAASQFNLLEFPSPSTTPEAGIEAYIYDRTQGPACATACAAGTAYRNYLVPMMKDDDRSSSRNESTPNPVMQQRGQTKHCQLNGLKRVENYLETSTTLQKVPWVVQNGYMEGKKRSIADLNALLKSDSQLHDALVRRIQIGVQEDATVTDCPTANGECLVTQTYNSAISIGYSKMSNELWIPMAKIVLQATYEATLLVAMLKAVQFAFDGNPKTVTVVLTKVGGGVFQNDNSWICEAIKRAIDQVEELITKPHGIGLDIRIVHFGRIEDEYMS